MLVSFINCCIVLMKIYNLSFIYLSLHVLNIFLSPNRISIHWKDTISRLYVNFADLVPWSQHTTWINSLVTCSLKICSSNKQSQELKLIYSQQIFHKSLQAHQGKSQPNLTEKQSESVAVYFRFPSYVDIGLQLCMCKIKESCKIDEPVIFKNLYMIFIKWSSFATPKTKLLLSINLLLCTSSRCY